MKVIQEITDEQIRKAEAYEALQIDLLDVQHPDEPVRECVLRLKFELLHLASLEAHRAWTAERDARLGTDKPGASSGAHPSPPRGR